MKALIEAKAVEDVLVKAMASTLLAGYLKHEEVKNLGLNFCAGLATIMELSEAEMDVYKKKAEEHLEAAVELFKETQEAVKH